ncbi:MAG: AraC family transcriptional regulator [Clostridia bacterium]|jgi:AraC-like DNA-binding protein
MNFDILKSILKAIAFIESNLQYPIGVIDVANAVSFSQFYFSREFSKHTHISIYDYIQRRRLSESYKELFNSKTKIVDIAFKYGFQSHEVYTRSFKKVFKENPSEVTVYKPLAVFEKIDEYYLNYTSKLHIESTYIDIQNFYFKINKISSVSDLNDENCYLILFSQENLFEIRSVMNGNLFHDKDEFLSFKIDNQFLRFRFYNPDATLAFKYFTNYLYDTDEMGSNYIIINNETDYVDILTPKKP